jgi:histone deacetylase 1/2
VIGIARLQRGLYVLDHEDPTDSVVPVCNSASSNSFLLWHLRLGHISDSGLQVISKHFLFVPSKNNMSPCDACHFSKQNKLPFPQSMSKSLAPFDILHADLWGPYSTISLLGHKYFLTLVDDYSRFTWVIFLKTKDEAKKSLINFTAFIEN